VEIQPVCKNLGKGSPSDQPFKKEKRFSWEILQPGDNRPLFPIEWENVNSPEPSQ